MDNEKKTNEKKPLTGQQRRLRQKMLVYPLMVLTFIGCMWLIFAPSPDEKERQRQGLGFNTDMPLPAESGIIADKAKAYELSDMDKKRERRGVVVGDLSTFWKDDSRTDNLPETDDRQTVRVGTDNGKMPGQSGDNRSSAAAYRRMSASLGTFYEQPKDDKEKEELRRRIDELEALVIAREKQPSSIDEQVALLEKSYELAAKYQNGGNDSHPAKPKETENSTTEKGDKAAAEPVERVRGSVVSALPQPMSDSAFIADYSGERNYGFFTAVGTAGALGKNTVSACIYGNQTVTDGQTVKLRLLESMQVAGRTIPRSSMLVGTARVQGERLGVFITSLEHQGTIIPVNLEVCDNDGQRGIFIPNSMEIDAAKEIGANMGSSLGSSINISTNAGAQLASDLGKGVIQGVSQYISKKIRTVKVHLKSGYKVLLYQEK